jgi:hypothetical protein
MAALMVTALPSARASAISIDGSTAVNVQTGTATVPITGLSTTTSGDFIVVFAQIANTGGVRWTGNFTVSNLSDSKHLVTWQPTARATELNLCPSAYGNSTLVEWYGVSHAVIPATDSIRVNFTGSGGANAVNLATHIFAVSGSSGFDANSGLTYKAKSCAAGVTTPTVSSVATSSGNDLVFAAAIGFQSQIATAGSIGIQSATPIQSTSQIGISEYTTQSGILSAASCTTTNSAGIDMVYWSIMCDALVAGSPPATGFDYQCPSGQYFFNVTSSQYKCSTPPVGGGPITCLPSFGYVCTTTTSGSSSSSSNTSVSTINSTPIIYPPNSNGLPPGSTLPSYTLPLALFLLAGVILGAFAYNSLRNKGTKMGRLGKDKGLSMTGKRSIGARIKGAFS